MSVSITLEQQNTTYNDDDNLPIYVSENEVIASEGITLALFVFAVIDETFNHVATVRDIETYPESKAQAVNDGVDYYRQTSVTREYNNIVDATAFATHVRARLNFLVQDYPRTVDGFVGSETYIFTTSES